MRNAMSIAFVVGAVASLALASPAAASPGWLASTDLSSAGRDASEPVVAMDEAGETVAVWQRQSDSGIGQVVQAATRVRGATFSEAFELSDSAGEPALAMTPSGEAVVVWRHFEVIEAKGYYAIQASYRPPGGSFSAPIGIAIVPNATQPQDIQVAIDPGGDTAVAWQQLETEIGPEPPFLIEGSVRQAGGSFTAPAVISPPPTSENAAFEPRLAIDAAGEATAVWTYENAGSAGVWAARGSVAAGFSEPPVELSPPGEPAGEAAIAMSPAGEGTAIWTRSNGASYVVEAAIAPPGGGFAAPVALSDPAQNTFGPEVASGPSGDQIAVWRHFDGANYIVEAASATGGSFAAPVALSEPGGDAAHPQVVEDRAGAATVVWQRSAGEAEIVQAAVGSASGFSAPVDLSAPGQSSLFPMVAMDSEGDATAVWLSEGTSRIVQAAGYDADAPRLDGLSIPTKGTVGVPVGFSASPSDVWPIASVAFAFGDGSSASGSSVSHTYASAGTYEVSVEAKDAVGTAVTRSAQIRILPSNEFAIGRLLLNRRRGTGAFLLTVPGPGRLSLFDRDVKGAAKQLRRRGRVKLPIVARGKSLRILGRRGAVHVKLAISFTPVGGEMRIKDKRVTLIKKIHRIR
jgi:PKD domain